MFFGRNGSLLEFLTVRFDAEPVKEVFWFDDQTSLLAALKSDD